MGIVRSRMKVPKILHRIWISEEKMPTECLHFGETWRFHHPTWTFTVWTQHNLPPMINHHEFHQCRNVAQKADILRYEILHMYGGVYVDTDFECLRSIESLVAKYDCFAAEEEPVRLSNAFIGCIAGHFLMRRLIRRLPESMRNFSGKWPPAQTGPRFFTRCARNRHGWESGIKVFSAPLFYALEAPGSKRQRKSLTKAYAVHHGHGGWHGQPFEKIQPRKSDHRPGQG